MRKQIIYAILILTLLATAGCNSSELTFEIPTADGRVIKSTYRREGNQTFEDFQLTGPNGWSVSFGAQKSEFQMGVEAAGGKITFGGPPE